MREETSLREETKQGYEGNHDGRGRQDHGERDLSKEGTRRRSRRRSWW